MGCKTEGKFLWPATGPPCDERRVVARSGCALRGAVYGASFGGGWGLIFRAWASISATSPP
jgi:hypothetical protein